MRCTFCLLDFYCLHWVLIVVLSYIFILSAKLSTRKDTVTIKLFVRHFLSAHLTLNSHIVLPTSNLSYVRWRLLVKRDISSSRPCCINNITCCRLVHTTMTKWNRQTKRAKAWTEGSLISAVPLAKLNIHLALAIVARQRPKYTWCSAAQLSENANSVWPTSRSSNMLVFFKCKKKLQPSTVLLRRNNS